MSFKNAGQQSADSMSPKSADRYARRIRSWSNRRPRHIGSSEAGYFSLLSAVALLSCTSADAEIANNAKGWLTISFDRNESNGHIQHQNFASRKDASLREDETSRHIRVRARDSAPCHSSNSLNKALSLEQYIAAIEVKPGVLGLERQRHRKAGEGFIVPSQAMQHIRAARVKFGILGLIASAES